MTAPHVTNACLLAAQYAREAAEARALAETNAIGAAELAVGQYVYRRIEALMDAKPNTIEGDTLMFLARMVEDVEEYGARGDEFDRTPIAPPPPEERAATNEEIAEEAVNTAPVYNQRDTPMTNAQTQWLLPCPFCRSHPCPTPQNSDEPLPAGTGYFKVVWCENCGAEGGRRKTDAEAIAAWNTRTKPQPEWRPSRGELADVCRDFDVVGGRCGAMVERLLALAPSPPKAEDPR